MRGQSQVMKRFGPWAVVTGASDGIGRELARALSAEGLGVVLVARRKERLDALALELGIGAQTRVLALDLASSAGVAQLLEATRPLDVGLFVAAAGFGSSGPFVSAELTEELSMVDLNCRSVLELSHGYAQRFVARRRGGLVLMSSLLAFQGVARAATYAATKAFIQTFAEGLRLELKPLGVEVLASAPGPVNSGFAGRANMRLGAAVTPAAVARGTLAALGRQTTVRPGWLSKVLEWSLMFLPRWGRVRALSLVMGGMTSHQGD